jgi:hypothetical protein
MVAVLIGESLVAEIAEAHFAMAGRIDRGPQADEAIGHVVMVLRIVGSGRSPDRIGFR